MSKNISKFLGEEVPTVSPVRSLLAALKARGVEAEYQGVNDAEQGHEGVLLPLAYGDIDLRVGLAQDGQWAYEMRDPEGVDISSHFSGGEDFEDLTTGKSPDQVDFKALADFMVKIANEADEDFLDGDGSHISDEDRIASGNMAAPGLGEAADPVSAFTGDAPAKRSLRTLSPGKQSTVEAFLGETKSGHDNTNLYRIKINGRRINCHASSQEAALAMAVRKIKRKLTAEDEVTVDGVAVS